MNLYNLKKSILNNTLSDNLIILKSTNDFLLTQYVNGIAKSLNREINNITSLYEPKKSALSLVFNYEEMLNVLKTDTFSEVSDDYSQFKSTVVVCKIIDKKLLDNPESNINDFIINIPEPTEKHIKEYILTKSPSLNKGDADILYKITNGNVYRILNELDKIRLLSKEEVITDLLNDKMTDLSIVQNGSCYNLFHDKSGNQVSDFFALKNCLFCRTPNLKAASDILFYRYSLDLDPFPLVSTLLTQCKSILYARYSSPETLADLKISQGYARMLKNDFSYLTDLEIKEKIKFLSSIEMRIQRGELELSNDRLLDYIISHIMA